MTKIRIEIGTPITGKYTATVFDESDAPRCAIEISDQIHAWHLDLTLAGYQLYWEGKGLRTSTMNYNDGITFFNDPRSECSLKAKQAIGKALIDLVCRNNSKDQSNVLRKMNDKRHVYVGQTNDRSAQIYVTGGYQNPQFLVRSKKNANHVQRGYPTIEEARRIKISQ